MEEAKEEVEAEEKGCTTCGAPPQALQPSGSCIVCMACGAMQGDGG